MRITNDNHGYWNIDTVEIETDTINETLEIEGEPLTAPFGFSYACSQSVSFANAKNTVFLKFENIQVRHFLIIYLLIYEFHLLIFFYAETEINQISIYLLKIKSQIINAKFLKDDQLKCVLI